MTSLTRCTKKTAANVSAQQVTPTINFFLQRAEMLRAKAAMMGK